MENQTRFIVETTPTQIARRPKRAKDGAMEVYVTRRQHRVFMYVSGLVQSGYTPSYQEVADACGYKTRDSAYRAVRSIAEHGLLTTDVRRTRSIQLTETGRLVYEQWAAKKKRANA
jgi:SOS-response transcriptional repressor LexA